MKEFFTLTFIVFVITSNLFSQWFSQNSGVNFALWSVCFVDANTGFVVGSDTLILKTTNGGTYWFTLSTNPNTTYNYSLYSLFFIDVNTGWAVGESVNSTGIMKTTNGGLNWIHETSPMAYDRLSVYFVNANTGWTSGSGNGTIFHTTNGGANWESQFPGSYITGNGIFALDSATCYVVGDSPLHVRKSTNGGANWTGQQAGHIHQAVQFINYQTGWVVGSGITDSLGDHAEIGKTTDGGTSWFMIDSSFQPFRYLLSVYFVNSLTGWAVGDSGIIKSTNGGINWVRQSNTGLASVFFVNTNTGWAVGGNGTILKTTNGGLTEVSNIQNETPLVFSLYQNHPNPFNPSTAIKYDIPPFVKGWQGGFVTLRIYDVLGNEVATLVNQQLKPGSYEVEWESSNFASGVYFYTLRAGDFAETKRMVLVK